MNSTTPTAYGLHFHRQPPPVRSHSPPHAAGISFDIAGGAACRIGFVDFVDDQIVITVVRIPVAGHKG